MHGPPKNGLSWNNPTERSLYPTLTTSPSGPGGTWRPSVSPSAFHLSLDMKKARLPLLLLLPLLLAAKMIQQGLIPAAAGEEPKRRPLADDHLRFRRRLREPLEPPVVSLHLRKSPAREQGTRKGWVADTNTGSLATRAQGGCFVAVDQARLSFSTTSNDHLQQRFDRESVRYLRCSTSIEARSLSWWIHGWLWLIVAVFFFHIFSPSA